MSLADMSIRLLLPGVLIGYSAVTDMRRREISLKAVAIFFALGWILLLFEPNRNIFDLFMGIFLGVFLLGISIASHGELGFGDGLIICVTGLFLGFERNLAILLIGLMLSSFFSILLIICGKGLKKEYPFIPFLMLSYMLVIFGGVR